MVGHRPKRGTRLATARNVSVGFAASLLLVSFVLGPVLPAFAQESEGGSLPESSQGTPAPEVSQTPPAPTPAEPAADAPAVTEAVASPTPTAEPATPDAQAEEQAEDKPPEPEPMPLAAEQVGAPVIPLQFQIPTQPQATVDQSTGALIYEYPIVTPKGRNGLTPSLALKYNSRNATRPDSITGLGWEVSIPYIMREPIKGTQNLYAQPYFSSSLSGNLIATTDASSSPYTVYRPESDDGSFLKYSFNSSSTWVVTDKNGLTYTFGNSTSTRQDDPSDATKIYKWMLAKVADTHGNEIQYSYTKDQGQIYPSQILYAYHPSSGAIHTISFAYTTPGSYGTTVYSAAFPITTAKLLSTITVTTVASGTTTDTYTLNYSTPALLKQRLLDSIDRVYSFASSAFSQSFSDTTSFSYSTKATGWEQGTHSLEGYVPYHDDNIFKDIYTADFDRNGYPDVLVSNSYLGTVTNHLMMNSGTAFADASSTWALPKHDISDYHAIVDLNGDELPDLQPRNSTTTLYLNTGSAFSFTTSTTWNVAHYATSSISCGPNVGDANSYNTNTFLYDINNDYKNDIVYFGGTTASPDFQVYLNTGAGFASTTAYTFTPKPGSSYTFSDNCTSANRNNNYQALIDVNGDGRLDYVHERYGTHLNTGAGFAYSAAYTLSTSDMTRTGLADINGDRLIDYVSFDGSAMQVNLNSGSGFATTTAWSPSELSYTNPNSAYWGTLIDVSADGFPDIVGPLTNGTMGRVRALNDSVSSWVANATGGSDTWKPIIAPSRATFVDINADGALDFIAPETTWDGTPEATSSVYMAKSAVPNRLTQITNPLGAQTVVTYSTEPTDYDDTDISPMPVVRKLTIQNVGHGQPTRVTQYAYTDGSYVIDPAIGERRFAGFHKVTATESGADLTPLRTTDTYFHQANGSDGPTSEAADVSLAKIGKPYYTLTKAPSGTPKKETWIKYATSTLATEPMTGRLSAFVYPTETVAKTTDAGATASTAETYTYDTTLGERTETDQLGFVTAGTDGTYSDIAGDTRYAFTEYAANASSTIVRPSREDIRTSTSAADTIARKEYVYDAQALGTIGSLGELTKESKWISGDGSTVADARYTYDGFGNVLTLTNPRSATTTYSYDSTNSYLATSTNPLGHATSYTYVTGKLTKAIDPNGFVITYEYSNKGWLYRITTKTDAGTRQKTQSLVRSPDLTWAITTTDQPITSGRNDSTWQTLDNLGRPVRNVRQRTNHATGTSTGYFLKGTRAYDPLGRAVTQGAPYGTSGSNWYDFVSTTVPVALVATTTYDVFNRPLMIINALGTTTLAYAGATATSTDPNGKVKTTKADAYGNLVEVDEKSGGATYVTIYTYDNHNLLTGLTDALGNVRAFTYNNAGWLTGSEDLHAVGDGTFGSTSFAYDLNGNQLTETEPNGTVVTRAYDSLDRPSSIDGSSTAGTDYSITYDNCTKGKGRICLVSSTLPGSVAFVKTYAYSTSTLPTSVSLNTQGVTSTISYQYTNSDGIKKLTYPSGTVVRYTFGDWALPSNVLLTFSGSAETTYATSTYHHSVQPATTTMANGLAVTNTYDNAKLYRKSTSTAVRSGTILQSYTYTYDSVGNITRILEPSSTKDYAYDDLYRLTQAVYTPPGMASTTYTYAYDAIGNVTSANSVAYTYSGTGKTNPHAVTAIGGGSYAYDDNGNVTNASTTLITYNWQKQPTSVTAGTATTTFTYDERGQRFLYQTLTNTEVQVDPTYLLRNGTPEITVKMGDAPIAVIVSTTTYATIADHLGTPVKQVNAAGSAAEAVSYGPFGSVLTQTGSLNAKRGYTGHEEDSDTGLVYANARYYSPAVLRFYQQDPSFAYLGNQNFSALTGADLKQLLQDPQQLNSYSYVRNNPIGNRDPDGRQTVALEGTGLALTFSPQLAVPIAIGGVVIAGNIGLRWLLSQPLKNETTIPFAPPMGLEAEVGQAEVPYLLTRNIPSDGSMPPTPPPDDGPGWLKTVRNILIGGGIAGGIYKTLLGNPDFEDPTIPSRAPLSNSYTDQNQDGLHIISQQGKKPALPVPAPNQSVLRQLSSVLGKLGQLLKGFPKVLENKP